MKCCCRLFFFPSTSRSLSLSLCFTLLCAAALLFAYYNKFITTASEHCYLFLFRPEYLVLITIFNRCYQPSFPKARNKLSKFHWTTSIRRRSSFAPRPYAQADTKNFQISFALTFVQRNMHIMTGIKFSLKIDIR